MKIHKKILSLLMALTIIISSVVPVFALSDDIITGAVSAYNPLWGGFIQSSMNNIYDYMQSQQFTQQWVSGNGAEATFLTGTTLTTPKNYFATQGQGASFQNGSRREKEYAGGTSSSKTQYRPIISSTYNTTNNNYNYTYNHYDNDTYYNYDITEINYNNEYNTYEFVTNNEYNFYITYSPTYVTVMYYDIGTQQSVRNDYYYQLPDGRSSYDLTANDVWGTYFIYNSVNYNEVLEDDGKTLGLFHFDGDLKNSAAVNTTLKPTVSSQTYNTGKFDYAVVQTCVDRSARSVSIPFLSSTNVVEFWVYYSSLTYDSSGAALSYSSVQPEFIRAYLSDGSNVCSITTDAWHHILLCKYNDIVYVYLNGVQQSYTLKSMPSSIDNYCYTTTKDSYGYYVYVASQIFGVDELRLSNVFPYSTNTFTPSAQPFDTNLVLVLPETGNTNDIAVKSNTPVTSLRVGGVRPTIPNSGDVYVYLEDDVVKDVQQYQTDGWYSVDASIYEGDTWVTLKDKDLSAYTITEDDFPTIDTDNPDVTPTPTPDNPSDGDNDNTDDENKDETTGLLGSIMDKITGFFTGLLNVLFGGILDLITVITDNLTGIIDGFTGITGLIGALFGFLPEQMTSVLTTGLAVIIIVVIIKIFI